MVYSFIFSVVPFRIVYRFWLDARRERQFDASARPPNGNRCANQNKARTSHDWSQSNTVKCAIRELSARWAECSSIAVALRRSSQPTRIIGYWFLHIDETAMHLAACRQRNHTRNGRRVRAQIYVIARFMDSIWINTERHLQTRRSYVHAAHSIQMPSRDATSVP